MTILKWKIKAREKLAKLKNVSITPTINRIPNVFFLIPRLEGFSLNESLDLMDNF